MFSVDASVTKGEALKSNQRYRLLATLTTLIMITVAVTSTGTATAQDSGASSCDGLDLACIGADYACEFDQGIVRATHVEPGVVANIPMHPMGLLCVDDGATDLLYGGGAPLKTMGSTAVIIGQFTNVYAANAERTKITCDNGEGAPVASCDGNGYISDVDAHGVGWCNQPAANTKCHGTEEGTQGTIDLYNSRSGSGGLVWCVYISDTTHRISNSCQAGFDHAADRVSGNMPHWGEAQRNDGGWFSVAAYGQD